MGVAYSSLTSKKHTNIFQNTRLYIGCRRGWGVEPLSDFCEPLIGAANARIARVRTFGNLFSNLDPPDIVWRNTISLYLDPAIFLTPAASLHR